MQLVTVLLSPYALGYSKRSMLTHVRDFVHEKA